MEVWLQGVNNDFFSCVLSGSGEEQIIVGGQVASFSSLLVSELNQAVIEVVSTLLLVAV